ncbi:hypothetical protein, partial [Streptomyces canarius]
MAQPFQNVGSPAHGAALQGAAYARVEFLPDQGVGGEDAGVEFQAVAVEIPQDPVGGNAVVPPYRGQGVRTHDVPAPAVCGRGRAEAGSRSPAGLPGPA